MNILPEGAELFRMDGQTDVTKTTVAFRSFVKAPNKTETCMTSAGFEHAILTIKRFRMYVLDKQPPGSSRLIIIAAFSVSIFVLRSH